MINGSSLVDAARRGDLLAFQTLVDRYQTPVFRFIYRCLGDVTWARHLTVKTFVAAHRHIKRIDHQVRFEAWLFRLAIGEVEAALGWRRLTGWLPGDIARQRSPDDDADAQDLQARLARLPTTARIAFLLFSLSGFTYDEIAHILRLSLREVRRRIARARTLLTNGAASQDAACLRLGDLLSAYVDRQLSSEERSIVDQHLGSCGACRDAVGRYQELDRRMARLKVRGVSAAVAWDVANVLRGGKPATSPQSEGRSMALLLALLACVMIGATAVLVALTTARGMASGRDDGLLYVGLQNIEGQVAVVDAKSARLVDTISVGARPVRLAALRDGSRVYVLGENGVLSVISTTTNLVIDRFSLTGRPAGMAVSPDDKILYVTLMDRRSVIYLSTATGRQTSQVRVGRNPREIAASPDGQWLLVFNSGDVTLSKIRASTAREVKVTPLYRPGDDLTEFATHPMAISPDSRKVYISELNRERIWVYDLASDDLRAYEVPLRDYGRDLLVAQSGDRLFVTHGDPRAGRAVYAGLASMALPSVERTAEIRGFYHGVATSPDGKLIFATNPDENTVTFADAVTLQTSCTVLVGQRPTSIVYVPRLQK